MTGNSLKTRGGHSVASFQHQLHVWNKKCVFGVCLVCWHVFFLSPDLTEDLHVFIPTQNINTDMSPLYFCGLTRRNGGRVCALRKRRADSLGMQQAGLHIWKQSLPHCHRRCTNPLRAVDCHRLAQRETLLIQPYNSTLLIYNGGKCT